MPPKTQLNDDFADSLVDSMPKAEPYLIAVSGGLDSMVLLHFLARSGYQSLVVLHVDHQLRGADSKADAELVSEAAAKLGLTCETVQVDVAGLAQENKISIELAARELRYQSFAESADRHGCPTVIVAHHADDQVETVLINLFRGSGAKGLMGMESVTRRDDLGLKILRPFLSIRRAELERYAAEFEVQFRHDRSNDEDFALRNRVRQTLLPMLHEVFERDVTGAVWRAAELAARDEAWMSEASGELPRRENGLDVTSLRELPGAMRDRLLLRWMREAGIPNCGFEEVSKISELVLSDDRPAKVNLPGDAHARRRSGVLFLEQDGEELR